MNLTVEKEIKYEIMIRNEERKFIITLLSDYGRVHLYYIDKEELLKEKNLSIEKMYADIPNPMDLIKHLQFNKVKSQL